MQCRSFASGCLTFLMMLILLTSCGGAPSGGTSAWIDVPLDGLNLSSLQPINIEGYASSPGGVSRVEVWVNGTLTNTITDLTVEGTLSRFHTSWTPTASGVYVIQAIAIGTDGSSSEPDSARVTFGVDITPTTISGCPTPVGGGPTPVDCPTLVIPAVPIITDTPTSPPPGSVVQFWAEPAEIEAGACTSIRWHVENVQKVVFGGIDQPFDGSYEDCLCADQRYTLTVTHADGSEEKPQVDIRVNGACITPTVPDTTPPPVPSHAVPADGLSIACKASQGLAWLPVDDPSGIARYEVQVQRHSGDNNWQDAPSGQISVSDKTTTVPVECGWYYRWRVRAVDGAGNASGWSGWSQFSITLS
ncbi:MAG: Ig-like domain-containing protein [Chloroflexota bacterium]